jgi:hypothetical protein
MGTFAPMHQAFSQFPHVDRFIRKKAWSGDASATEGAL